MDDPGIVRRVWHSALAGSSSRRDDSSEHAARLRLVQARATLGVRRCQELSAILRDKCRLGVITNGSGASPQDRRGQSRRVLRIGDYQRLRGKPLLAIFNQPSRRWMRSRRPAPTSETRCTGTSAAPTESAASPSGLTGPARSVAGGRLGPTDVGRSTNAGTVVPATGDNRPTEVAQSNRSTKAGMVVPATAAAKVRRLGKRRVRSTKAGTVVPATGSGGRPRRGRHTTLNEGRDRSPGDSRYAAHVRWSGRNRSTKAGTVVPATAA